ncbi:alpha 1,2-mannosyltransferase 2.4.1 [Rhizophlyctis rosea]|uniref:Alpha 1,2-mannosyltransferase 2.4.1 n=1 Tax=Rhizophlyctis rosea TaxID=64517 RepID=A0AAD5SPB1_9FUNG|nr:alpha 1,2-mannosyltransferase 2.4.1 [Rhizophlyctis rosea]
MSFQKPLLKLLKSTLFRLLFFIITFFFSLVFLFRFTPPSTVEEYGPNDPYGPAYPNISRPVKQGDPRLQLHGSLITEPLVSPLIPQTHPSLRANAAIVILCRNSDLGQMLDTLSQFEDVFNREFGYPYVFINDVPFTPQFKNTIRQATRNLVEFGEVESESWSYPSWINQTKAEECMHKMEDDGVIYGGSLSYRHMCRFYSGFFFRHPLVRKYDWYWRVEPGVSFLCKIPYDPFVYMHQNNKEYGFVISLLEVAKTIPTLWEVTRDFAMSNGIGREQSKLLRFFVNDETGDLGDYNMCHFWSNFEIARRTLFDSPTYLSYFNHLDRAGGFFYERWGDAPIHSLALPLLGLNKSQVHFFNDIGYQHEHLTHCIDHVGQFQNTCQCGGRRNFDRDESSCLQRWVEYQEKEWTWWDPL